MADKKTITALIVDDEPPGRHKIRVMLKHESNIEIIGECTNGTEAVETIQSKKPDLVFLDVQMPEMDGFDVIKKIGVNNLPEIIFITAYEHYALQAFEVHALDYLLKPFDKERFQHALQRAKDRILERDQSNISQKLLSMLHEIKLTQKHSDRLVVKSEGKVFFLKTNEIDWIEAAGNYVRLHTGNESHLLRETMSGIQKKLNPNQFIRIHRSTFVNIEQIKELQPWFHGEYVVILKEGTQLTMSRGYRNNLTELLGKVL